MTRFIVGLMIIGVGVFAASVFAAQTELGQFTALQLRDSFGLN